MPLVESLGTIPWKDIIIAAPSVVEAARRLYDTARRRTNHPEPRPAASSDDLLAVSNRVNEIQARLREIEAADERQAELITCIAEQTEALSQGLTVISARMARVLWVAVGAIVVALVAVVLQFIL